MSGRDGLRLIVIGLVVIAVIAVIVVFASIIVSRFVSPTSATYVYWVIGIVVVGVVLALAGISQITGVTMRDFFPPHQVERQDTRRQAESQLGKSEVAVLLEIYNRGKGNTVTGTVDIEILGRDLGMTVSEIRLTCRFLEEAKLIRHFEDTGRLFVITHPGVIKARQILG